MAAGYKKFRLRDVPVLKALHQFGTLYQKAVQHRIDQTQEQLKTAVELAVIKSQETQKIDDAAFEKAKEAGSQMKEKFNAHMREIGRMK